MPVGVLALDLAASVPVGHAKLGTPPACGDWSGEKDVRLIDIGQVSQWSRSGNPTGPPAHRASAMSRPEASQASKTNNRISAIHPKRARFKVIGRSLGVAA